jgi:CheY-like chemotaxis protein
MAAQNPFRVLVVEDEFLIAMEIAEILEGVGHQVVGPVSSVQAATEILDGDEIPDAAIIDANLRNESSAAIAHRLRGMGIPFFICTGYRLTDLQANFGDVITLQKPIVPQRLLALIDSMRTP